MLEMQDAYREVGGRQCLEQIVEQFPAQIKQLVSLTDEYSPGCRIMATPFSK